VCLLFCTRRCFVRSGRLGREGESYGPREARRGIAVARAACASHGVEHTAPGPNIVGRAGGGCSRAACAWSVMTEKGRCAASVAPSKPPQCRSAVGIGKQRANLPRCIPCTVRQRGVAARNRRESHGEAAVQRYTVQAQCVTLGKTAKWGLALSVIVYNRNRKKMATSSFGRRPCPKTDPCCTGLTEARPPLLEWPRHCSRTPSPRSQRNRQDVRAPRPASRLPSAPRPSRIPLPHAGESLSLTHLCSATDVSRTVNLTQTTKVLWTTARQAARGGRACAARPPPQHHPPPRHNSTQQSVYV
jgi:hypothetical protein